MNNIYKNNTYTSDVLCDYGDEINNELQNDNEKKSGKKSNSQSMRMGRESIMNIDILHSGEFDRNLRFIRVMDLLDTNTRQISDLLSLSVGTINAYVNKHKPQEITEEFAERLLQIMPFLNIEYIINGKDFSRDMEIKPFKRRPNKKEKELFKVPKTKQNSGIDLGICHRMWIVRDSRFETQQFFADSLGFERYIISSIEGFRQKPSLHHLIEMRRRLGINEWWIMTGEGDMYVHSKIV